MQSDPKESAVLIARSLLGGRLGVLDAAWALCPLVHSDPTIASKEERNLLIAMESETDHLPVGRIRQEWHPDFLPEKDREIARCEELWRAPLCAACERILLRAQQTQ